MAEVCNLDTYIGVRYDNRSDDGMFLIFIRIFEIHYFFKRTPRILAAWISYLKAKEIEEK